MAEHTPAPWQACQMYQEGVFTIRMGSFSVHGLCGAANARLIADAPETAAENERLRAEKAQLLAALEKISALNVGRATLIARAAIAKGSGSGYMTPPAPEA